MGPCALPFNHLHVWYKVHLQQTSYHDHSKAPPAQTTNTIPPNCKWEHGHYDMVLIQTDDHYKWPDSGLNGHTIVQLHLIMCPLTPKGHQALYCGDWEDTFLAYIECFDIAPQLNGKQVDHATQMPILKRALPANALPIGDVIPFKQLCSFASVIPRFGAVADHQLNKSNVMKYTSTFFLNRYFDKEFYYALSSSL
ncbi:hypothetical protein BV22DRAFT_1131678 [Leucogyrophana mollusca]|uniref:Uncharacterized protein n=1 Tax=Leucogyrophana mollusca TaxID=85980 RepID=A0ACB8BBG3_9AGAM|nr:hypothetical protein BV22DRAFT_1131678 [Leucogyrophana mollusca]